ncbi:hypothetical protein F2P81_007642 [Scophthalmus maximus]|uniref:Uncharacterized protein n=1 Tax=Scophthalmus maximus TaxID=52904 RepID=A0A6A4T076_SCOMX|nr:hypothetical protein F2P81_007642 [Scophthalmus maximus]
MPSHTPENMMWERKAASQHCLRRSGTSGKVPASGGTAGRTEVTNASRNVVPKNCKKKKKKRPNTSGRSRTVLCRHTGLRKLHDISACLHDFVTHWIRKLSFGVNVMKVSYQTKNSVTHRYEEMVGDWS